MIRQPPRSPLTDTRLPTTTLVRSNSEARMELYRFRQGSLPLLVSMPHPGTYVPPEIEARLTEVAKTVPDTDWHKPRLYAFLQDLDVSVIEATHSRYVIDLNRSPDSRAPYAGADRKSTRLNTSHSR